MVGDPGYGLLLFTTDYGSEAAFDHARQSARLAGWRVWLAGGGERERKEKTRPDQIRAEKQRKKGWDWSWRKKWSCWKVTDKRTGRSNVTFLSFNIYKSFFSSSWIEYLRLHLLLPLLLLFFLPLIRLDPRRLHRIHSFSIFISSIHTPSNTHCSPVITSAKPTSSCPAKSASPLLFFCILSQYI